MRGGPTATLASFVVETEHDDLPAEVVHETKRIILDSVGCALGGLTTSMGKIVVELAKYLGGREQATIIGTGDRTSCPNAAFVNGELINALDFDVITPPGHSLPCVLPAAIAMCEHVKGSGKKLIEASTLGIEIAARIGSALTGLRSFEGKPPEVKIKVSDRFGFGSAVFGAAAAAGKLLGLDEEGMANAFGIAGYNAAVPSVRKFLETPPAPMNKYTNVGLVALVGVISALLAAKGFTGDTKVLDGEFGFWKFYGSSKCEWNKMTGEMGKKWYFLDTGFKPYPCCRNIHPVLDCFIKIVRENGLQPEEISSVTVKTDPFATLYPMWRSDTKISSYLDAQMNLAYNISAVAYGIKPGPRWQSQDVIKDPNILAFMRRVKVESHPRFIEEEYSQLIQEGKPLLERTPTSVEIAARDKIFKEESNRTKGDPYDKSTIMTDEELAEKFRTNAQEILPLHKVNEAIQAIRQLEQMEDLSDLIKLLIP